MENKLAKYFTIENQIGEIPVLAEKIEGMAEHWKLSDQLTMNINLVVEEALSNIIFYAFCDNKTHKIRISFSLNYDLLTIRITDDGIAFDPTLRQQPDISLPAVERPIGGLGIFLISKIMDAVHYARKNNRNILILKKEIRYEHKTRENQ
jgi:anti-sigma regulatory factor (Ser/Thr protein kinase)